jgi:hypothetical protein
VGVRVCGYSNFTLCLKGIYVDFVVVAVVVVVVVCCFFFDKVGLEIFSQEFYVI